MQTTIRMAALLLSFWSLSISNSVLAQVTVNFSASETSGCGLVQSSFTDLSTTTSGVINSWSWDLDGSMSNIQNPSKTFSIQGTYTICLSVSTTTGATGSACKTDFIEVFSLPQPDFSADNRTGCLPHTVNFTNLTTSDAPITQYIWGVGGDAGVIVDDGSLPSIQNTYPNADTYTISLTVQDANGCTNSIAKPAFIEALDNPDIQVTPSATSACNAPLSVDFSNDNIQPNTSYSWDFGNGQTFQGPTPGTIVYNQPGVYSVTVDAINTSEGCNSQLVLTDLIEIGKPVTLSSDIQSLCLGAAVQFTDTSEDPAQLVTWDFGDGNNSNAVNPSHTYAAAGCYTVTLTREVNGCISIGTLSYCVDVSDIASGTFTITNPIGCALPATTNFTTSTAPGSTISWDFGDGNTGNGLNPSHDYDSYGTFTVIPTISNAAGCSIILPSQVVEIVETRASPSFNEVRGCSPLSFAMTENSYSSAPITDWLWEIIDDAAVPPVIYSSTQESPFVTLSDTGVFDVQLTVTNAMGCMSTRRFDRYIYSGVKPNSDFTFLPDSACRNEPVSFIDNSTGNVDEWVWYFGDGTEGYDQNPTHQYEAVGLITVELITLNNGCPDTLEMVDVLEILEPRAGFATEVDCADFNLRNFYNGSTGSDILHWDFGVLGTDTDTASTDSLSFTYPGPGTYMSSLVVENISSGCTDTIRQEIVVTDLSPELEILDSVACAPYNLRVVNTSQDAVSYLWTIPGASISDPTIENPGITYQYPGTYTNVSLEVVDTNGCVETLVLNTPIIVSELDADFTPATITGCAGSPIDFTNQSTSTYNTITSAEWIVGANLDTLSTMDANYAFNDAGDYPMQLTVRDDGGCVNTFVYPDLINITDPKPDYTTDLYSCTFAPLQFEGTGIGEQLNYTWNFGDGNIGTGTSPAHQYSAEGQYQICVSVEDKNNCVADTCGVENVIVLNPIAGFAVDNNYGACPPLLATFVNNSNNAINYLWDFGDNSGESNLETPPHVYTDPGTFDVTLVAYTSDVCTDTLVLDDYINLDGPIGDFSFNVEDDCAPGLVTFVANSMDAYDFYWDYGDGNIDTTLNVDYDSLVYSYDDIGAYHPKLILVDNVNCQRVIELPDSIVLGGFNYDFNASDTLYCGTDPLTSLFVLDGVSTDPLQETTWSFPGAQTPTSTVGSPLITYDTPGIYDVEVILDNGACRDTIIKENYIRIGALPEASMALDVSEGCSPLTVQINDFSSISDGTITGWNWDFEDQGISNNQNNTVTFDTPGIVNVSVEVISDVGCSGTSERSIKVFANPTAEVVGETNICVGEEATITGNILTGQPGGSVIWSGGPIVGCTDCMETVVNPPGTTTYNLMVTDGNGCTTQADYQVYVRSAIAPTIDLGTDTSICMESSIILDLQIDQQGTTITWDTNSPGLSCYNNCPEPNASPTTPTTYYVEVRNVDGCRSRDSIAIGIIDDRQDFLGPDETICVGNEVQLITSYGDSPMWKIDDHLSCLDCPDPMANPSVDTKFYLDVMSENGCLITDSILVLVQEPMAIEAGADQLACVGVGATMEGAGIGIPTWFPTDGVNDEHNLTTQITPTETTMYFLSLDDGVCVAEDSVLIEIIESAEVFTDGGTICEGEIFVAEADGIADEYTWHDPSGPVFQGTEFEINPPASTNYYVVGEMNGCSPDTAYFEIEVNDIPDLAYPSSVAILPGYSQKINPSSGDVNNLEFTWTPAMGLSCTSCPDPIAAPESETTYRVDIFNPATGCTVSEDVRVRLRSKCGEDLIVMPNVFSPNGDGRNDEFKIVHSTVEVIKSFRIYDRWGQLHFETDNVSKGWNGVTRGKKVNAGVYVYLIEAECPIDGSTFYKKGDVTVMR